MATNTLHMIGNAHIDPVWLWRWQEGCHEALATFRSALDRLAEYPGFVFMCSSAALYEWVEGIDPAMFEEIRARVREGRWRIVGGWWVEPDCNIPCGESFVRQALYGQRYFRERFGATATVGYNPDSFGHAATLPQLLRRAGLTSYVFMRPGPHEMELPGRAFHWEGPDGSRVTAFRIIDPYCAWPDIQDAHIARCAAEEQDGLSSMMCFYGVGNHGGGPTRANLDGILRHQAAGRPQRLIFSHPDAFFDEIAGAPLPVHRGELQHHARGCYAAHSGIKRGNRRAENALLAAEALCAMAGIPAGLSSAWKLTLFNQFHDTLGGTSLPEAYEDAAQQHGEALSAAARSANTACQRLAWNVNLPHVEGTTPLVAFNPLAWPIHATLEVEVDAREGTAVEDAGGNEIPCQAIRSEALTAFRRRIAFRADLPALGWKGFRVCSRPAADVTAMDAGETFLENDRLRLDVDPATGLITLRDNRTGATVLRDGARAAVLDDPSDTWSHGIARFDRDIGSFAVRSVRLAERGPVLATLRVESAFGDSSLAIDYTLPADGDEVLLDVRVDWRERRRVLKLRFPTGLSDVEATYSAPYGHVVRPANGEEEPAQDWIDVSGAAASGARAGLGILNDGTYSFSVEGGTAGVTLLRSPIYAHHDPAEPDPSVEYEYQDQGAHRFRLALVPHHGDWRSAALVRRAAALNRPPELVLGSARPGRLPAEASFASSSAPNVDISVVKAAEDGEGIVLRAWETAGRATEGRLDLPGWGAGVVAAFGACEVKTFRLRAGTMVETDLLEGPGG